MQADFQICISVPVSSHIEWVLKICLSEKNICDHFDSILCPLHFAKKTHLQNYEKDNFTERAPFDLEKLKFLRFLLSSFRRPLLAGT